MAAAVKERPILFSGPMVRAILDGKKTQTRRVVKLDAELKGRGCASLKDAFPDNSLAAHLKVQGPNDTRHRLYCPYGYKGERLWVRETWRVRGGQEYEYQRHQPSVVYKASSEPGDLGPWKPSIFMRRWASRITLDIQTIRVERLHQISPADVYAEGVGDFVSQNPDVASEMFARLWNKINEARGCGWATNPWVWVIEFRRVVTP